MHLRVLSPLPPGLKEAFQRFRKVMTIEINYSDPEAMNKGASSRRRAQLAMLLRDETLFDVDCWSRVPGVPLAPGTLTRELLHQLEQL
jgi:2-oxoglutarate ferredoxin oxidoreductase subunit alpha